MRADRVAIDAGIDGSDHRAALAHRGRAPADGKALHYSSPARMGGQADMTAAILFRHGSSAL